MFLFLVTISVAQVIVPNVVLTAISAPKGPCFYMNIHLVTFQDSLVSEPFATVFTFNLKD